MPWYKAGTVSVALNSNAVTGSGTAFIVNCRVGDAFRGPDGGWYEIINVASDTALAIDPPYQGASEAAGAYALAPMQGYVKDSADQLRAIVNTYGAKLAALGTTGNYDILPASKGGTGITDLSVYMQGMLNDADDDAARATLNAAKSGSNSDITSLSALTTALSVAQGGTGGSTQATARGGLGLGAVAVENVVPVEKGGTGGNTQALARTGLGLGTSATANTGTAVGNVMLVGAFGLGASFTTGIPATSDINGTPISQTGIYRYTSSTVGRPTFSNFGSLLNLALANDANGNYGTQLAIDYAADKIGFRRITGASGWSTWNEIYHTANTTRGSGGALSAASPIVRVASVSGSLRGDLLEQTFEAAGDWGVANDEARGVNVQRISIGEYRITGALGLALEGWRTQDPCSPDGGRTLGMSVSEEATDGTVTIKLFKQRWTLSDDGEMIPGPGAPMDVPLNSWIDVRLNMPAAEQPPMPESLVAEAI